jgi:hypothetical protein
MMYTDCIGSCNSNYHTITTTTVPTILLHFLSLLTYCINIRSVKSTSLFLPQCFVDYLRTQWILKKLQPVFELLTTFVFHVLDFSCLCWQDRLKKGILFCFPNLVLFIRLDLTYAHSIHVQCGNER